MPIISRFCLNVLICFCLVMLFADHTNAQETGAISGYVYDESTGTPLEGIWITVHGGTRLIWLSDTTDENGYFIVTDLPSGSFVVSTSNLSGYIDEKYDGVLYNSEATLVKVLSPNTIRRYRFGGIFLL